jgi:hypothetical protein
MNAWLNGGSHLISVRLLIWAIAVFLGIFTLTHFVSFPGSLQSYMEVTQGQKIFDLVPSFTVGEVYQRLGAMSEAGRTAYKKLIWTVDFVFPVIVLFLLVTCGALRGLPVACCRCGSGVRLRAKCG